MALQVLRVGADHQVLAGRPALGAHQADAGVHRAGLAVLDRHRVDVHLDDLREVDHQLGQADEQFLELFQVRRRVVAVALEQRQDTGLLHHPPGQQAVQRRQAQGLVMEHLGVDPARAEQQHRAEVGVGLAPHEQLEVRVGDEGLQAHAGDARLGVVGAGAGHDPLPGLAQVVLVAQVELDAAGVGLVADVRGDELHHQRHLHVRGQGQGLVQGGGEHRLGHRDAVGGEHPLAGDLVEHALHRPVLEVVRLLVLVAAVEAVVDGAEDEVAVEEQVRGELGRGLGEQFLVARVLDHVEEGAHRPLRGLVGGDVGPVEDVVGRGHAAAAHPRGEHREALALDQPGQGLGHLLGADVRLVDHDDQHAVELAAGQADLHRPGEPLQGGVAEDVDGVVAAPVGRQDLVQLGHDVVRDGRRIEPVLGQRVRGHDARAAAVGDDRQARAGRPGLFGHQFGAVEQAGERGHADDAGPFEGRIVDRVLADHGADVGGGGAGAGLALARLEHDDRLDPGHRPGRAHELAGVGQVLHVDEDRLDVAVVAQVVDHVAEIHIEHGADGDEVAEADVTHGGPVQAGGADGAALGDEADDAVRRHAGDEAGVELPGRADHAQAVGADDAQAGALEGAADLLLDQAALLAQLAAAGGDDDHPAGAGAHALAHHLGRGGDGHGDDGQVGERRRVGDGAEGFEAVYLFEVGVHRQDGAVIAAVDEVLDKGMTDGIRLVAGADHGDAFRVEELFHGNGFPCD